jgi:hypothetical protein
MWMRSLAGCGWLRRMSPFGPEQTSGVRRQNVRCGSTPAIGCWSSSNVANEWNAASPLSGGTDPKWPFGWWLGVAGSGPAALRNRNIESGHSRLHNVVAALDPISDLSGSDFAVMHKMALPPRASTLRRSTIFSIPTGILHFGRTPIFARERSRSSPSFHGGPSSCWWKQRGARVWPSSIIQWWRKPE